MHLDHCFARILLDNACGGPWREAIASPAWANAPPDTLRAAIDLGEATLEDRADLALLDRRSLAWRGKGKALSAPAILRDRDLVLRRWRAEDEAPFAALNADPGVMRHFPSPLSGEASVVACRRFARMFVADGFGPWALEVDGHGFLGFVGGTRLVRPLPFPGGDRPGALVEIAFRLAPSGWGRGFATRAVRLAFADLFDRCGLAEIVGFTALTNTPSRRVMQRLGMRRAEDFAHPALAMGHPLRPHALYRISAAAFRAGEGESA